MKDPIVIVAAKRTPMGGLAGELSPLTASQLGAISPRAALEEAEKLDALALRVDADKREEFLKIVSSI